MKKIKNIVLLKKELHLVKQPKVNAGIANLPLLMYVNVVDFKDGILKVEFDNQSGYSMNVTNGYGLCKVENRQYKEIVNVETTETYLLNDLEKKEILIDLKKYNLTAGLYMLAISENRIDFQLKR